MPNIGRMVGMQVMVMAILRSSLRTPLAVYQVVFEDVLRSPDKEISQRI